MNLYVDIDGTLTDTSQAQWGNPIMPRIEKLRQLIDEGHFVVLWTGAGADYAREFGNRYGINAHHCLAKPDVIVDDNPTIRPRKMVEGPEWLDQ